jgi:phage tail-like protein
MTDKLSLAHGMSHRFAVTAGAHDLGSWSKVAGLSVKWDVAEYRRGNSDQVVRFAAIPRYEQVKLSRAADAAGTAAVQTWLADVQARGGVPEEGAVEMSTSGGIPVAVWNLREMFPVGWQISEFDATSSKVAVETLTIVHGGFLAPGQQASR